MIQKDCSLSSVVYKTNEKKKKFNSIMLNFCFHLRVGFTKLNSFWDWGVVVFCFGYNSSCWSSNLDLASYLWFCCFCGDSLCCEICLANFFFFFWPKSFFSKVKMWFFKRKKYLWENTFYKFGQILIAIQKCCLNWLIKHKLFFAKITLEKHTFFF